MNLVRRAISVAFGLMAPVLGAQSTAPVLSQSIAPQALVAGDDALTLDLRNYFSVPGISGQLVQFDTVLGPVLVELRADAAPHQVANFLAYVQSGAYANTFFHRSASFDNGAVAIVQGGGYRVLGGNQVSPIPARAPVALEYNLPNARGTLAAARTGDPNSATSEWFFNVRDNSTVLGPQNGGGYTVFGRVVGNGLSMIDAIAALPRQNGGAGFAELPVRNYSGGDITANNLVVVNAISPATVFPTGGGGSAISFGVQDSASGVVATTLSGSTLTLTPLVGGRATITVSATDTTGAVATTTFEVTVGTTPPAFTRQPVAQTVATGSTVVLTSSARDATHFQWRHNGADLVGATGASLLISRAAAADGGTYVAVATNAFGTVTSDTATLTVVDVPATQVGRLINLSVLTSAGAGAGTLTVGAVAGPLDSPNTLPLVVRAVGPTLAQPPFSVPGVLSDPVLTLHASAATGVLASNDDWGGGATLANAFTNVGAFALPADSADAAISLPGVNVGGYTVQVTGKGDANGLVLAEIYDAAGAARTASTPRLVNLSVLKRLDVGTSMTAGFVISGQTDRTVLVRAIGPGLVPFGVADAMKDPQLALFNSAQAKIAENNDWGGDPQLVFAGNAVGAFPLASRVSSDAVLLVTLAPGNYTAQVSGVNGVGGSALVEVYEVP